MKIELQFNSIVVSLDDLDSIVGSFVVPSGYSLPKVRRKHLQRNPRRRNRITASTLLDRMIAEIEAGR